MNYTTKVIQPVSPKGASTVKQLWCKAKTSKTSLVFYAALILLVGVAFFQSNKQAEKNNSDSLSYIAKPKVNDIYFLDYRKLSDTLRPQQKYRLAKVVDITGDVITFRYSNMLYFRQQAAQDSIRYGQLRYVKFFEPKRYDFNLDEIRKMWDLGAIYMVKRPVNNQLYGNYVSPVSPEIYRDNSSLYTPGKREYIEALSFLSSSYIEDNLVQAFSLLQKSSSLGYAQGQVSLGELYINPQFIEANKELALHWFKQASLQSNKAAILKYGIVCKQVAGCNLASFYQELYQFGVNIKVRQLDFKLSPSLVDKAD